MKKTYLKPEINHLTIIESGGIMDGISSNTIDNTTGEKDRDPSLDEGGNGDGTDMGAKSFDVGWDLDDFDISWE